MTPEQARGLKAELAEVSSGLRAMTAGMDANALLRRPSASGWSVAENLQHLILTADAMEPLIESSTLELQRDSKTSTKPSGLGLMGWMLVKALEPPRRMKSKTAPPFEPVPVGDPTILMDRLQEANDRFEALITKAVGLATSKATVTSPFNAKVKYNLYAAFRIAVTHLHRHLEQAKEAKAST